MKCVCCKFDNCKAEFEKHRSNTSFLSLDTQFDVAADLIHKPADFVDRVCEQHKWRIKEWLDGVFAYYDTLKPGVRLTKITRRA